MGHCNIVSIKFLGHLGLVRCVEGEIPPALSILVYCYHEFEPLFSLLFFRLLTRITFTGAFTATSCLRFLLLFLFLRFLAPITSFIANYYLLFAA